MHPLPECLWATVKIFFKRMQIQLSGDADAAPGSRLRVSLQGGWEPGWTWEVLQAGGASGVPALREELYHVKVP